MGTPKEASHSHKASIYSDDAEAYNNNDEMLLFTDFTKKISLVEKNLPKDIMPWERKGVKGKVVTAGPT